MAALAPIVLFAYNRPLHTEETLAALMKNDLADQSTLFIYADGAKENATEKEIENIEAVRNIIRSKKWCGTVNIIESSYNKGLAISIVEGVTSVVNKYDKVIVLEDDIVTSKGFLRYMNDALDMYESNHRIMSVSGFMFPINSESLPDVFCYSANTCWGWATWKRAWKYFDFDIQKIYNQLENSNVDWRKFNAFQHTAFQEQVMHNLSGKIKTWAVKWHAAIYLNKGTVLHPKISLVKNIGFDGTGVHCNQDSLYNSMDTTDYISVKVPFNKLRSKKAEKKLMEYFNTPIDRLYFIKKMLRTLFKRFK